MSGGYFNYKQYQINEVADKIEHFIKSKDNDFNKTTLRKIKKGLKVIRAAAIYANRIDWLLSGDNGEETFLKRLTEELKNE